MYMLYSDRLNVLSQRKYALILLIIKLEEIEKKKRNVKIKT